MKKRVPYKVRWEPPEPPSGGVVRPEDEHDSPATRQRVEELPPKDGLQRSSQVLS